jgi:type II secretory pathway pseudopilin PulG
MKLYFAHRKNKAFTWVEIMVVIVLVLILVAILAPVLGAAKRRAQRLNCASNLNEIGFAYLLWQRDHYDQYPMSVSVTNGGGRELIEAGNMAAYFTIMSNYLAVPKILTCPADSRFSVPAFIPDIIYPNSVLNNSNISYFVGLSVDKTRPKAFISGDDNIAIGDGIHPHPPDNSASGDIPVKSGLLELSSNAPIWWTGARHKFVGNIVFNDGSVQQTSGDELQQALLQTKLPTNRLEIP